MRPHDISAKTLKCTDVYNLFNNKEEDQICDLKKSRGKFYCDINEINASLREAQTVYNDSDNMLEPTIRINRLRDELIVDFEDIRYQISKLFMYIKKNITDKDCEFISHEDVLELLDAAINSLTWQIRTLNKLFPIKNYSRH